jgi:hypothetical protein
MFSVWNSIGGLTDRLLRLHANGDSCNDIATALSNEFHVPLSRNAVIGKLRRLNPPPPKKTKYKAKIKVKVKATPSSPAPPKTVRFIYYPPPPPSLPAPASLRLSIYQLDESKCRYPSGESPPYEYCGLPPEPGCPYCSVHCRLSHTTPRKRWE